MESITWRNDLRAARIRNFEELDSSKYLKFGKTPVPATGWMFACQLPETDCVCL